LDLDGRAGHAQSLQVGVGDHESTPSTPASIMRLTALQPPPPTPMTLMRASLRASSWKLMRMFPWFSIGMSLLYFQSLSIFI